MSRPVTTGYVEGSKNVSDFAAGNVGVADGTINQDQTDVLNTAVAMHIGNSCPSM